MKSTIRWQYLLSLLLLGTGFVLAVIYRSWLIANWVRPLALVLWAVVRVFLSVHQSVYWTGLIFLAFYLALRILPQRPEEFKRYPNREPQEPVNRLDHWYQLIRSAPGRAGQDQALKKELQILIDDWQRAKKNAGALVAPDISANYQDLIPDAVSNFLVPERKAATNRFWQRMRWMKKIIMRWMPWQSNQSSEYEDAIEAVVDYIETNVETNIDG
jgi:hypothetical protein